MPRKTFTTAPPPSSSGRRRGSGVGQAFEESGTGVALTHRSYAEEVALSRGSSGMPIASSYHAEFSAKQSSSRASPISSNGLGGTTASRSPSRPQNALVLRPALAVPDRSISRSHPITSGPPGSTSAAAYHSPARRDNPYSPAPRPAHSPAPSPRAKPSSSSSSAEPLAQAMSFGAPPPSAPASGAGSGSSGMRLRGPIRGGVDGRTSVSVMDSPSSSCVSPSRKQREEQRMASIPPRPHLAGPIRARAFGSTTAAADFAPHNPLDPPSARSPARNVVRGVADTASPGVIRYTELGATSASYLQ